MYVIIIKEDTVMKGKKIFYIIFVFICMTPFITKVSADCDYQRLAELSKIANNVKLSYNYDSNANFTVTLTNLTNDIYVTYYNPGTLGTVMLSGATEQNVNVGAGTTLTFDIYSSDPNCSGKKLVTKYISTPFYNYYSTYDECKENPNFKYCQRWLNVWLTNSQFENEFVKYKQDIALANQKSVQDNSVWSTILNFFRDNVLILSVGLGIVILIIILVVIKRLPRRRH